jgi:hypothetical protein
MNNKNQPQNEKQHQNLISTYIYCVKNCFLISLHAQNRIH